MQAPNDGYLSSLDYASRAVHFFEDWINISYPQPKLEFISVDDLPADAFNSWGLSRIR